MKKNQKTAFSADVLPPIFHKYPNVELVPALDNPVP